MRNLWDALSSGKRGGYAESAEALEIAGAGGDPRRRCDHGQGLARLENETIVAALEKRFPGKAALDDIAV